MESYLQHFAPSNDKEDWQIDLICSEMVLCWVLEEAINVEEYMSRFPQFEKELTQQYILLELHPNSDETNTLILQRDQFDTSQVDNANSRNAFCTAATKPESAETQHRFPSLPGYQLVDLIGRGSSGTVYKAEQLNLKKMVALKVLRSGQNATVEELTRFHSEAEAIAQLDHPHIIRIFDIGEYQGDYYLALELAEGGSLDQSIDGKPQPPRDAATLVHTLTSAVQTAHDRGIIHRDLKPSNILLAHQEIDPEIKQIPKISDFGLAKQLGSGRGYTLTGMILGTPRYMAPEQIDDSPDSIGPATDVYSLGVILYELLTGGTPFRGNTEWDTMTQVREQDPVPPNRIQPKVPKDLNTICLKCLQKNPRRRYASSGELGEDLRRFLDGRPILARSTPPWEHFIKWARRHPITTISILVVLILWISLMVASSMYQSTLETQRTQLQNQTTALKGALSRERDLTNKLKNNARMLVQKDLYTRKQTYAGNIQRAKTLWDNGQPLLMRELIRDSIPRTKDDFRGFEWYYLWKLGRKQFQFRGHTAHVRSVAISPSGKLIASGANDHTVKIRELSTGRCLESYTVTKPCEGLTWSYTDRHFAFFYEDGGIVVLDRQTGKKYRKKDVSFNEGMAFLPDNQTLIFLQNDPNKIMIAIRCWNWRTGKTWDVWNAKYLRGKFFRLSPDGRFACFQGYLNKDPSLLILDVHKRQIQDNISNAEFIDFLPEKGPTTRFIYRESKNLHRLMEKNIDTEATKEIPCPPKVPAPPWGSPMISAKKNHGVVVKNISDKELEVLVWDLRSGKISFQRQFPILAAYQRFLSPEGDFLIWAGRDGQVHFWHLGKDREHILLPGPTHGGEAWSVDVSPNGKLLAVGYDNEAGKNAESLKLWDLVTAKHVATLPGFLGTVMSVEFSPNGTLLATGSYDGTVQLWNPQTRKKLKTLSEHKGPVRSVTFSADGRLLASAGSDKIICIWKTDGTLVAKLHGHKNKIQSLVFTPDGTHIVSAGDDQTVRVWDVQKKQLVWDRFLDAHLLSLSLSPDAKTILTGGGDGVIRLLSRKDGQIKSLLFGHKKAVRSLAISPDGKTLASGSLDGVVILWQATTQTELIRLKTTGANIHDLTFTPNSRTLIGAAHDGNVILWSSENIPKVSIKK